MNERTPAESTGYDRPPTLASVSAEKAAPAAPTQGVEVQQLGDGTFNVLTTTDGRPGEPQPCATIDEALEAVRGAFGGEPAPPAEDEGRYATAEAAAPAMSKPYLG